MPPTSLLLPITGWIAALLARRVVQFALPSLWPAPAGREVEQPGREIVELLVALACALLGARGAAALLAGRPGAAELALAMLALPFAVWIRLRRPAPASFGLTGDRATVRILCALLISLDAAAALCLIGPVEPALALRLVVPVTPPALLSLLLSLAATLLLAGLCSRAEVSLDRRFAVGRGYATGAAALVMTLAAVSRAAPPGEWIRPSAAVLLVVLWLAWHEVSRTRDITWFLAAGAAIGAISRAVP